MAATLPTKGAWARKYGQTDPTGTALIWGTGINPVHYVYGSPPDRLADIAIRQGEVIPAYQGVPEELIQPELWGYTPEDSSYVGVEYDNRPRVGDSPEASLVRATVPLGYPPLNATGGYRDRWRARRQGAFRWYQDFFLNKPSETVSEGWLNKPASGRLEAGIIPDAKPSDPEQYERQTSMQQRYQVRVNDLAVDRNTDDSRSAIASRVVPMKIKEYSGGERHYDMLPKEQDATRARPFWYRTAGTGPDAYLVPNEVTYREAVDRTPPPDPYIGTQDTDQGAFNYGYTSEDYTYA